MAVGRLQRAKLPRFGVYHLTIYLPKSKSFFVFRYLAFLNVTHIWYGFDDFIPPG